MAHHTVEDDSKLKDEEGSDLLFEASVDRRLFLQVEAAAFGVDASLERFWVLPSRSVCWLAWVHVVLIARMQVLMATVICHVRGSVGERVAKHSSVHGSMAFPSGAFGRPMSDTVALLDETLSAKVHQEDGHAGGQGDGWWP